MFVAKRVDEVVDHLPFVVSQKSADVVEKLPSSVAVSAPLTIERFEPVRSVMKSPLNESLEAEIFGRVEVAVVDVATKF